MTRDELLALVGDTLCQEPQIAPGGVLFHHMPSVGEFAFLARIFDPASPDKVSAWATAHDRGSPYLAFLTEVANGLAVANISLFGVIEQVDRSGWVAGQAISLDYGNVVERPANINATDMVIGGIVGWSSRGSYVMDREGSVRLSHHQDAADVAATWPDLQSMLRSELTRIARLHDREGRELGAITELMHPNGRRWETETEPRSTRH